MAKKKVTKKKVTYFAVVDLDYPDPDSLDMVLKAGGRRNLTQEQYESMNLIHVAPGEECLHFPTIAIKDELRIGRIRKG